MCTPSLLKLEPETVSVMHPGCASSVFWEFEPSVAERVLADGSERFEKEAWVASVLLENGECGFSLIAAPRPVAGEEALIDEVAHVVPPGGRVIATVLYCQPAQAPGSAQLPTAPVSPDARLLSSLHIDALFAALGLESVLVDAVLAALMATEVTAVEAFAYRRPGERTASDCPPLSPELEEVYEHVDDHGILEVSILESAGFKVVEDHPYFPRLRIELPPPQALLTAEAVEQLLAGAVV